MCKVLHGSLSKVREWWDMWGNYIHVKYDQGMCRCNKIAEQKWWGFVAWKHQKKMLCWCMLVGKNISIVGKWYKSLTSTHHWEKKWLWLFLRQWVLLVGDSRESVMWRTFHFLGVTTCGLGETKTQIATTLVQYWLTPFSCTPCVSAQNETPQLLLGASCDNVPNWTIW